MRRVLHRFARDAGQRGNALARAKEAPVAPLHKKANELGKVTTGIGNDLSSFAAGVNAGVLKGSATGTAYAPSSPILSQVIQSPAPAPPPRPAAAPAEAAPAAPARSRSLAELKKLPSSDLSQMLAERGVSGHTATDKDDLAKWVHEHQHLPVISRPAATPDGARMQSRSIHELRELSVAELKDMRLGFYRWQSAASLKGPPRRSRNLRSGCGSISIFHRFFLPKSAAEALRGGALGTARKRQGTSPEPRRRRPGSCRHPRRRSSWKASRRSCWRAARRSAEADGPEL
ncbi:LSMT-L [Symbiodinium natans]|uniref:LSMT-L protein n=1 Tax=Symbiodinium natans TaxID=878477 RepID=A0A812PQF2_9DINO|nr:LSMT-L [Symbiodinium natans]